MSKNNKKTTAPKQESENPAAGAAEKPTPKERNVDLETRLAASDEARKRLVYAKDELKKKLAASEFTREELVEKYEKLNSAVADLGHKLNEAEKKAADAQARAQKAEEELAQLKTAQAEEQEPEKPKGPPPKPRPGDCRSCVHYPVNASENGRAAEDWLTRTKGFSKRPCGSGPCVDKKFARE